MEQQPTVSARSSFLRGTLAMIPLIVAVTPWGILVGAYGIESGLSALQTQSLSLLVFAGTSQLVAIGMLQAGLGIVSILVTTLLITSRHLLYSMAMRDRISPLPLRWRLTMGFLLTDELFVNSAEDSRRFNRWYALGGGLSFYIAWNLATLAGILAGAVIPDLTQIGLDFAVVATFIAIVVPMVKSRSVFACVVVSAIVSVYCTLQQYQAGLLLAIISGMIIGYLSYKGGKR
ncbi:AzlC family ABC transporter permease [Neptuniibacter halophilus]|uniref:AzlC family ABC transporter permease n=1 Tax=Neptuniibacter halophilus TaxID=651666 RepID=UPI0025737DA5|nr:AzlC family ABC transporter permease [Neptuniibacter halophilus]